MSDEQNPVTLNAPQQPNAMRGAPNQTSDISGGVTENPQPQTPAASADNSAVNAQFVESQGRPQTTPQAVPSIHTPGDDSHKASFHSRLFDGILQTLSGGPTNVVVTDPVTGVQTTKNINTKTSMANSIIAGALSSLFTGSQGRGASPDFKVPMGSTGTIHTEQQAAAQKAIDDAQDRKMKVVKSNLETIQSQLASARMQHVAQQQQVDDGVQQISMAKTYDENKAAGDPQSIQQSSLNYSDALTAIQNSKMQFIAVPDGFTSKMGADGKIVSEPTYTILDPHVKVKLTTDDRKMLAATNPQWANAPDGTEVPLSVVNSERLIRSKAHNVTSYLNQLAQDPATAKALGVNEGQEFDVMTAAQDRTLRDAINNTEIQMAHGAGTDIHYSVLDAALTSQGGPALLQKLGISPELARKWLDTQHDKRMSAQALAKTGGVGPKSLADQDQINAVQASIKALPEKDQRDFASYIPEADDEGNINMSKADLAKAQVAVNQRVAQNANLNEKNALANGDPAVMQKFANNTIEGDVNNLTKVTSMRGNSRLNAENAIHDEATKRGLDTTQFSQQALENKANMSADYAGNKKGSTGSQITSFNAFLGHTSAAVAAEKKLAGKTFGLTNTPAINAPMSTLAKQLTNDADWKDYQTALVPVQNEIENFLAGGYAVKAEDAALMKEILDPNETPARMTAALRRLAETADIRLAAIGQKYLDTMGTTYTNLMSSDSRNSLKNLNIPSKADAVSQTLPRGWQNNQATKIDKQTAQMFYRAAGNDPVKAQALAKQNGWSF